MADHERRNSRSVSREIGSDIDAASQQGSHAGSQAGSRRSSRRSSRSSTGSRDRNQPGDAGPPQRHLEGRVPQAIPENDVLQAGPGQPLDRQVERLDELPGSRRRGSGNRQSSNSGSAGSEHSRLSPPPGGFPFEPDDDVQRASRQGRGSRGSQGSSRDGSVDRRSDAGRDVRNPLDRGGPPPVRPAGDQGPPMPMRGPQPQPFGRPPLGPIPFRPIPGGPLLGGPGFGPAFPGQGQAPRAPLVDLELDGAGAPNAVGNRGVFGGLAQPPNRPPPNQQQGPQGPAPLPPNPQQLNTVAAAPAALPSNEPSLRGGAAPGAYGRPAWEETRRKWKVDKMPFPANLFVGDYEIHNSWDREKQSTIPVKGCRDWGSGKKMEFVRKRKGMRHSDGTRHLIDCACMGESKSPKHGKGGLMGTLSGLFGGKKKE